MNINTDYKKSYQGVLTIIWSIIIFYFLRAGRTIYLSMVYNQTAFNMSEPADVKLFTHGLPMVFYIATIVGLTYFASGLDKRAKSGLTYIRMGYLLLIVDVFDFGIISTGAFITGLLIILFGFYILSSTTSLNKEGLAGVNMLFGTMLLTLLIQLIKTLLYIAPVYQYFITKSTNFGSYTPKVFNFLFLVIVVMELIGWVRIRTSLLQLQGQEKVIK